MIRFTGGETIKYTYSADGRKLRAAYTTVTPVTSKTVDYCGNLIFENGQLKQVLVDGGYIPMDDWSGTYRFYVKDHLGNNRMVVHQSGTIEQVNNYYPYGGLMANTTGWNAQRFKYNGKEFDRMHGLDWYDYGARWMDASIGRWHSVDPLAEDKPWQSPYLFCSGNPIIRIDPDGMEDYTVNEFGQMYESTSYLEAFFETIFSLFGGGCNQDRIYKEGSDKLLASYPEGTINLIENNSEITQIEIKENKYAASFTNMVMKETNVEWARISHGKTTTQVILY